MLKAIIYVCPSPWGSTNNETAKTNLHLSFSDINLKIVHDEWQKYALTNNLWTPNLLFEYPENSTRIPNGRPRS